MNKENDNDKKPIKSDSVSLNKDYSSLEGILLLETFVDKLENSTIASQFKEYEYDKDEDGNPIESTKRIVFNKADMVMCIALGNELGIPPYIALAYGKQLNLKAVKKIEKGRKLGLDYASALEGIYIWGEGAKEIVYTSIHIVNSLLSRVGIKKEIINNGTKAVIRYTNPKTSEVFDAYDSRFKVIPKGLTFAQISQVADKIEEAGSIPVMSSELYIGEVKLKRTDKLTGEVEEISIPYSSQQAIDAGLLKGIKSDGSESKGKDNWNAHPSTHLLKMSTMLGSRMIAADALGGIYLPDEISFIKTKPNAEETSFEEVEEVKE